MMVIIQYNAGNIQSVRYALQRTGAEATVTDDPALIRAADRVIFPGVGEASTAMDYLKERGLDKVIRDLRQPVLGICLGMQLMCAYSEENDTDCLGIFGESVRLFRPENAALKVPQIGWNTIYDLATPLFDGLAAGVPASDGLPILASGGLPAPAPGEPSAAPYVYFVHSYYASLGRHTIATTDYVLPYSAALHRDNFYGVQFHPEKSAGIGETILKNFLSI